MKARRPSGRLAATLLLLLPLAAPAVASPGAEAAWEVVRNEGGIRSYRGVIPGSPLLAFKGEVELDREIARVLSVVLDAERVGEWIPRLIESKVLRWLNEPYEYMQFTRFDAPWPVTDRVFLSRVVLSVDGETRRTELRYFDVDEPVPEKYGIRGLAGGSYYILEPLAGGRQTRLTAVSVADPRGRVPAWLVNWAGSSWAYDTMARLRAQVHRPDIVELPLVTQIYADER